MFYLQRKRGISYPVLSNILIDIATFAGLIFISWNRLIIQLAWKLYTLYINDFRPITASTTIYKVVALIVFKRGPHVLSVEVVSLVNHLKGYVDGLCTWLRSVGSQEALLGLGLRGHESSLGVC